MFSLVIVVNLFQLLLNLALRAVEFAQGNLKGARVLHAVVVLDDECELCAANAAVGAFKSNLIAVHKRYHIRYASVIIEHKLLIADGKRWNAATAHAGFLVVLKHRENDAQGYQEIGDNYHISLPLREHERQLPVEVAKHGKGY